MTMLKEGDILCKTGDKEYYIKNGTISERTIKYTYYSIRSSDLLKKWRESLGYDSTDSGANWRVFRQVAEPYVGKPISEAENKIKEMACELNKRRERYKTALENQAWINACVSGAGDYTVRNTFSDYIVGLAKEIDVYDSGFSVRVLLITSMTFEERRDFVKKNKVQIVKWVLSTIEERPKILRKIGDIRYYKPVEITTLRSNEVEIKFEVKDISVFENRIIASPA